MMSDEVDDELTDGSEYDGRYAYDRRKLLSGLGTVGAMAVAGCSGGSNDTTTTGSTDTTTDAATATETMQETTTTQDEGDTDSDAGSEIGARFGYTATSPEETPPVEPDHTVTCEIQPVEGRPIPQFYFEPVGLTVEPGDTVKFQMNTPHHNVNAYHPGLGYTQRVPDGVPPFSSPVLTGGDYWLYTFEEEGVYDYMCAPHEVFGMVGRIVVGSATGPGASPIGEAPGGERARPPEFTAALVYEDPAMAPDNIASQGSVSWADLADESKRLTLVPAEVGGEGGGGESGSETPTPTPDGN
jgi:plastocyanin